MYKKVLVPLDGCELSEHALEHLNGIAVKPGFTSVILMRVAEPPGSLSAGGYFSHEIPVEAKEQAEADAHEYLAKKAKDLSKKNLDIKTVVTDGIPADDILNYAAENEVDLIIMSTHGRSGLTRWLSGSVAEKVMRHSTVPVLISPPPGARRGRRD